MLSEELSRHFYIGIFCPYPPALSSTVRYSVLVTALTRLYLLAALLLAAFTLYGVCLSLHWGPFRDMWVAMDFIRAFFEGRTALHELIDLHGGAHRLALPRLLFVVDYGWFAGSNVFLLLVALVTQLSVVLLMALLLKQDLRQQGHLSSNDRLFLLAMTLLLMINPTQLENFLYTFDVQWFLTAAFALWALAAWQAVVRDGAAGKTPRAGALLLALVATLCSLFSSFSGLCLLLVLPLLPILYRCALPWVLASFLACAASVFFYLQGPFSDASHWIGIKGDITVDSLLAFITMLSSIWARWTILYLGSPLSRDSFALAAVAVVPSLAFVGYHLLACWRRGPAALASLPLFALLAALFATVVALATGWGRMHFINTANEDRYQSIVLVYWLGVFTLAWWQLRQLPSRRWLSLCVGAVIGAWTLGVIPRAGWKDWQAQVNFFDRVNSANLAIATGQWDFQAIRSTLILGDQAKFINRPEQHGAFLRERQWGAFASPGARLLGHTLPPLPADRSYECPGVLLSVLPMAGPYRGYRLTGRAVDPDLRPLRQLLVLDGQQRVLGLGRLQREKDSPWPLAWQAPQTAQWIAYTQDVLEPLAVVVWGQRDDGRYCRVVSAQLRR